RPEPDRPSGPLQGGKPMLGLIITVLWLGLFVALSLRWEKADGPVIRHGAGAGGSQIQVDIPGRPRLRSAALLAVGIGLAPFWFVFGNNCLLTIPPAHVAAVYDPLRGGIQPTVLPEGFHVVMPWWQTQQFSQQTQEYTMSGTG